MQMSEDIPAPNLAATSKRLAHRTLLICENRIELLLLEVEQERERILRAIGLGVAVVVFGVLTGVALTAIVAVAFWPQSPLIALVILAVLYALAGAFFYVQLARLQQGWLTLPATLEQLRKDGECLKKILK